MVACLKVREPSSEMREQTLLLSFSGADGQHGVMEKTADRGDFDLKFYMASSDYVFHKLKTLRGSLIEEI